MIWIYIGRLNRGRNAPQVLVETYSPCSLYCVLLYVCYLLWTFKTKYQYMKRHPSHHRHLLEINAFQGTGNDGIMMPLRNSLLAVPVLCWVLTFANGRRLHKSSSSSHHGMHIDTLHTALHISMEVIIFFEWGYFINSIGLVDYILGYSAILPCSPTLERGDVAVTTYWKYSENSEVEI